MKLTKKYFAMLLALLMVSVIAVSCGDDEENEELTLPQSTFYVSSDKSSIQLNINSNTGWTITNLPTWIDASPISGAGSESVTLTISENPQNDSRSASIEVATSSGSISKVVNVTQNGKDVKLNVDVTSIILPSTANASQTINITCNDAWEVKEVPEWLQISSVSGFGNSSIVITTRSANESSSPRSATLGISSNDITQSINVQQEASLSSCQAVPSNVTTLYYAVIFNLSCSQEVALTKMSLLSDYDYKHMTEKEIINKVETEDSEIPEDETIYTRTINEATKYHIITLAYDKKGNRGELIDVVFESPEYLDGTDDAWCAIDDAGVTSSEFLFSVEKKGRCSSYDVIYGANLRSNLINGALMAYEINYYRTNGKKNWLSQSWNLNIELNYPNNHIFACKFNINAIYGGVIATTWGIFSNGSHSSDTTTVGGDVFENSIKSLKDGRKNNAAAEWLKKQKGWIKITPRTL